MTAEVAPGWIPLHYSQSKLTPAQRDEIAFERGDGIPTKTLASKYGVSTQTIRNISVRERP